jgi:sulfate/thiosulfate-binding protein
MGYGVRWALIIPLIIALGCSQQQATTEIVAPKSITLLNASYDPTRELYADINASFAQFWKEKHNQEVRIEQSHGGSGKQARSVIDGLKADVVTLALGYDIDAIAQAGLIDPKWEGRLSNNSAPYTSTIVFVVRKGNPKNIADWGDLIGDVSVITPNPKTSGGARWNYLAARAYAQTTYADDPAKIGGYMTQLFANVPVLDSGARGSTTTFVERKQGDVLLAWENEAMFIQSKNADQLDIIYPSISILAQPTVAVVDAVAKKHGTIDAATAYLEYLYTEEGQNLIAKHFFRPTRASIQQKYADTFPNIRMLTIADFGGWQAAHDVHFKENGVFDQIMAANQ